MRTRFVNIFRHTHTPTSPTMDLFVLDTVGEQTALEERIVPKLSKQKNPALQLLEPTISQPQQQHRNTQNADHEDDNADDDDDTDDDGDDDADDDEDCGGRFRIIIASRAKPNSLTPSYPLNRLPSAHLPHRHHQRTDRRSGGGGRRPTVTHSDRRLAAGRGALLRHVCDAHRRSAVARRRR